MLPSFSAKQLYWQIYCERVDPLVKILHKPTIEKIVLQQEDNSATVDKSVTALLFAIYFSAVTSMTAEELLLHLGQGRAEVIKFYKSAIEQALLDANFLETQEMIILQAFILYLICIRCNGEPKSAWALTGLAMRLGQSLGLHRDGTNFGLPLVETETRRRLWWQLWYLDVRASEDHGSESDAIDLDFNTNMPLNINDSDLTKNMPKSVESRDGITDSTFSIIRYEMARASCMVGNGTCGHMLVDKEKVLQKCYQELEIKYLPYCHGGDALHWLIENVTRVLMDKSWFMLYYSPSWLQGEASMSRELRDRLFITAI